MLQMDQGVYSELDLKLMNVKQLRKLLQSNNLKIPRLKADMVKLLLENNIRKDGTINEAVSLENLPPEIHLNICEQMDTQTLSRYLQTGKTVPGREFCQEILNKRKKLEIESLIQKYNFAEPEFEIIFNMIANKADYDDTLWKIKSKINNFAGITFNKKLFRGNLYRAILRIQKYFYDEYVKRYPDSFNNFLNYQLGLILDWALDAASDELELVSPSLKTLRQNPEFHKKFIDILFETYIESLSDLEFYDENEEVYLIVKKEHTPPTIL